MSIIKFCLNHLNILACRLIQCHAFREILTYQSVMIFIQFTLSRMVGVSKIIIDFKRLLDLGVISKRLTVIKRDSAKVCFVWV